MTASSLKRSHHVIRRDEMLGAILDLGGAPLDLSEYATTGLMAVGVGPRGHGKTNAGLLMAEQLAKQGWVSVLIDPEAEIEGLYGEAVAGPEALQERLELRDQPIVVVRAAEASEFVPYGQVILAAADSLRKPLFVMLDEGQLFSSAKRRAESLGEAADIVNEFVGRGRKRALDLYVTALRYTGSLHRQIFANKNLTLIGCQEDATAWAALAPQFKASGISFGDLSGLTPSEFFCVSRRGIEKVKMPMAQALKAVAPRALPVKRNLPSTFSQWDRAMRGLSRARLERLTDPVTSLLGQIVGLTAQQINAGQSALQDELASR